MADLTTIKNYETAIKQKLDDKIAREGYVSTANYRNHLIYVMAEMLAELEEKIPKAP